MSQELDTCIMTHKSETVEKIEELKKSLQTQLGRHIKVLSINKCCDYE